MWSSIVRRYRGSWAENALSLVSVLQSTSVHLRLSVSIGIIQSSKKVCLPSRHQVMSPGQVFVSLSNSLWFVWVQHWYKSHLHGWYLLLTRQNLKRQRWYWYIPSVYWEKNFTCIGERITITLQISANANNKPPNYLTKPPPTELQAYPSCVLSHSLFIVPCISTFIPRRYI